jgi:hypothetical protein
MRTPIPPCRKRAWLSLGLLLVLPTTVVGAQVVSDSAAVAAATQAAVVWLDLIDYGKWDESWDTAAPDLQQDLTKEEWAQALIHARGLLEPLSDRTFTGATFMASIPNAPPGPYVVIEYRTRTGAGKEALETVTPRRWPDGTWRVSGYLVQPVP